VNLLDRGKEGIQVNVENAPSHNQIIDWLQQANNG